MSADQDSTRVSLDTSRPIWEQFFTVAPLVLVGSREAGGEWDFAPKHMAFPMGWENLFAFVCTPRHQTYHNIARDECFTVTYPRPSQILFASLAATSRDEDGSKPALAALPKVAASEIDGWFLKDGYLFFECRLERMIDGFGENSLICGRVVAAQVDTEALRSSDVDDSDVIRASGIMAYLHPGRFAAIDQSLSFPYAADFRR